MASKAAVRRQVKILLAQMTEQERVRQSRILFDHIISNKEYQRAGTIFVYMSLPEEVQTDEFILRLLRDGKRAAVPRTDRKAHRMRFFYMESFSQLQIGMMGIREPDRFCRAADDAENALMILPGLAYDKARHRIGYGGGFYDRYLAEHPRHPTIGVAYGCQIFEEIPTDDYDIRPDCVYTGTGLIYGD